MPIHYQTDKDYSNKQEEMSDMHEAIKSKSEVSKPENIKDFEDFLKEEEPNNNVQSENR